MPQLSAHFSEAEFTRSATAARMGIDNTLPADLLPAARATAEMMERIRRYLSSRAGREIAINLTSGYRCPKLNAAVGSGPGSDHPKAMATDFEAPGFGTPTEVARALAPMVTMLDIGQLINEYPDRDGWVHVSTRLPDKSVNRIITITARGTSVGV